MGGACGYDNMYAVFYGASNTIVRFIIFKEDVVCGVCYEFLCDAQSNTTWCIDDERMLKVTYMNLFP